MAAAPTAPDGASSLLDEEARRLLDLPATTPLESLPEPGRSYLGYALNTLERGQQAMAAIATRGSLAGVRYLDVGVGWGGFLAAAAERGAREVVGLDVDARLVDIASRFLAARGIAARVQQGDATDAATMAALREFDVITCNDVVEHVLDVPGCLANLARAVAPGGRAHLAIPNRFCPRWIRSDPHFFRFGIVLLARPDAIRYARIVTGFDGYDVGDYFRFDQYRYWLERHGLEVQVANVPPRTPATLEQLGDEMREIRQTALAWSDPQLPADLVEKVRAGVLAVTAAYQRDARHDGHARHWRLLRRYAVPVWEVVAWRRPGRPRFLAHRARAMARRLYEEVGR